MSGHATTRLLQGAAVTVMVSGVIVAGSAYPATAGVTRFLVDLIFWPIDGQQSLDAPETRLLGAVCGGVMAGWGLMLWLVAARLYPREPALARSIILGSVAVWFVTDSTGSVMAGAPLNAVFNVGFLLAFWLPLRRPAVRAAA